MPRGGPGETPGAVFPTVDAPGKRRVPSKRWLSRGGCSGAGRRPRGRRPAARRRRREGQGRLQKSRRLPAASCRQSQGAIGGGDEVRPADLEIEGAVAVVGGEEDAQRARVGREVAEFCKAIHRPRQAVTAVLDLAVVEGINAGHGAEKTKDAGDAVAVDVLDDDAADVVSVGGAEGLDPERRGLLIQLSMDGSAVFFQARVLASSGKPVGLARGGRRPLIVMFPRFRPGPPGGRLDPSGRRPSWPPTPVTGIQVGVATPRPPITPYRESWPRTAALRSVFRHSRSRLPSRPAFSLVTAVPIPAPPSTHPPAPRAGLLRARSRRLPPSAVHRGRG